VLKLFDDMMTEFTVFRYVVANGDDDEKSATVTLFRTWLITVLAVNEVSCTVGT